MKQNSAPTKIPPATNIASTSRPISNTPQTSGKRVNDDANDASIVTTYVVVPPDGGWGWIVMIVAFICNLAADGILYSFGELYLDIFAKEFDAPKPSVSIINSLLQAFQNITGPLVSALTNRYGFRKIAFLGGIISSIGFGVSYFATSVEFLCVSFGVMGGTGFSMQYVVGIICVSFYFERKRPFATCVALTGSSVGGMVLGPIMTPLVGAYGWRNSMLFLAGDGTSSRRGSRVNPGTLPGAKPGVDKSVLDVIAPLMHDRRDSYRIAVGLDNNVQNQRIEMQNTKFDFCRRLCCCQRNVKNSLGLRPMYRDDIFFEGTRTQYNSQIDSVGYNLAVSRIPTKNDVREDTKCVICPESVKRILATMLDCSLFYSPTFILLCFHCTFMQLGLLTPFVYLPDRAVSYGMVKSSVQLLVPTIMIASAVARITLGILATFQWVDMVVINYVLMTAGGISLIVTGFTESLPLQLICCVIYGSSVASFYSLRSTILVKLLGLERLTNAFGLLLMFDGISALVGPPLAGWFMDLTGSYDAVFWYAGCLIILSAGVTYPLNYVNKKEKDRDMKREREQTND